MDSCTRSGDSKDDVEAMKMSYESLKSITDNFSEERLLGSGTFGMVYKGTHKNGEEIAVKVLRDKAAPDDKDFQNEFQNLAKLDHTNIVQLVGYCNESEDQVVEHEGRQVTAEKLHMALCFEYVDNGNLNKYISDENQGLQWHVRYKIIKGICEGLKHLHKGLNTPVLHLDLKPHNILLDKEMIPKIADFGLSRIIGDERTRQTMNKNIGTGGYLPPEYTKFQLLSPAFDIYSLGIVITKIMVGKELYHDIADMRPRKLVNLVHNNWKKRLQAIVRPGSLEVYCHQVMECIKVASKCLMEDRHGRLKIEEIVDILNKTEMISIPAEIEEFEESKTSVTMVGTSDGGHKARRFSNAQNMLDGPPYQVEKYSYELLSKITNNFSEDRLLGRGGFGKVYQGVYEGGQVIAVKVLYDSVANLDEKRFINEIECMANARHENITQLLGYCSETTGEAVPYNGRLIYAERRHRSLCFQYMRNGSLENYISDESHGLDWCTRYKIIKGTCDGLRYLHEGRVTVSWPILHLGLKPANILLDGNMVPKIADFGESRLIGDTRTIETLTPLGTMGYMPPEFISKQVITKEFDIYSLGIIVLKIISGMPANALLDDLTPQEIIVLVVGKWRTRLQATLKQGRSLEACCQQVKKCIEIALKCLEQDRRKRPNIGEIVRILDETETVIHDASQLLHAHPMELCFPFMPKKCASSLLHLCNKEDDHVAFRLLSKSPTRYDTSLPLHGIVPPRCTYTLALTTSKQRKQPLSDCDKGFVLQSIALSYHQQLDLSYLGQASVIRECENLFEKAQESGDDEVQEVTLKSVVCAPPAAEASSKSVQQPTRQEIEIIATLNAQKVLSMEVHPNDPWIMTTHEEGNLRVWNYNTMEVLKSFEDERVYVAKFIAREEWIVAGDGKGCIHVFSYDESQDYTSFEAHKGRVMSLAVHPTHSYVLSSSHDDHLIKLWHWDQYWDFEKDGWVCTRTFEGHSDKVSKVIFNLKDTDSFASASRDGTVKIWGLNNSDVCDTITLDTHPDGLLCVDFISGSDRQHLVTVSKDGTAQIWDLEIKRCREYLQGHANHISVVYSHREHQKLITGSLDGTIRIWDSITYRLENIIALNLGPVSDVGYIEELQRIVVGCHQGIAMMEVKFS